MARYLSEFEINNFEVNGQTFDLVALIEALDEIPEGWTTPESVKDLHVGQIVYVSAMARLRRGVVIKLGRTKVSVAFTTRDAVKQGALMGSNARIRVADGAVQLNDLCLPPQTVEIEPAETDLGVFCHFCEARHVGDCSPADEVEEFTPGERSQIHNDLRTSGALDDAHAEALAEDTDREAARIIAAVVDAEVEEASQPPRKLADRTGSSVVSLLERIYSRIRANHPELPEMVIITGSGLAPTGGKWGHFRPKGWVDGADHLHEMFMAGETLAKGARQVLQTMLHESAHALAEVRGKKDTSRQGRWHNATFRSTAEELGLRYLGSKADKKLGFSAMVLTEETIEEYADLIGELEAEIQLKIKLPVWMGGEADETDEGDGGDRMGRAPRGGDEEGTKTGPLKAVCECPEPLIIRLSRKVLDLRVVRCDTCEGLFSAA